MKAPIERRYSIREVSELTGVAPHVLRQWETKISQLNPRRNRANRRYYLDVHIGIVRRIQHLLREERLTLPGVKLRLGQETHGEGGPHLPPSAQELLEQLHAEARALENLLDSV